MWVAEYELDGKSYSIGKYAHKHDVGVLLYINSYTRDTEGNFIVNYTMFVKASQENFKGFIDDLKRHETVLYMKTIGNRLFCQMKQHKAFAAMYNPDFIFLDPIEINLDNKGVEKARVYSWNKQSLVNFSKLVGDQDKGKLRKIHTTLETNFLLVRAEPRLTVQQRKAIELAIKQGYYEIPRKATLEELSKMMGVKYSTFQVHLRKAEKLLLPMHHFVLEKHEEKSADIYR